MEVISDDILKTFDHSINEKSLSELRIEFESKFKLFCKLQGKPKDSQYYKLKSELLELQDLREKLARG